MIGQQNHITDLTGPLVAHLRTETLNHTVSNNIEIESDNITRRRLTLLGQFVIVILTSAALADIFTDLIWSSWYYQIFCTNQGFSYCKPKGSNRSAHRVSTDSSPALNLTNFLPPVPLMVSTCPVMNLKLCSALFEKPPRMRYALNVMYVRLSWPTLQIRNRSLGTYDSWCWRIHERRQ